MKFRIEINRDECLACGACTICDNWELASDGRAKPIKYELEEVGCNEEASEMCPVGIIKIFKK